MQRCRWKPYVVGNQSFKACLAQQGKKVAQVYQALSGSTTTGAAPQAAWGYVPEHWGRPRGQRPPAHTRRAVSLGPCPMLRLVLVPPVLSLCLWEQGLAPESLGPLWDSVLLVISFNTPLFHAKCALPSAGCQVLCLWHPSYQHIFVAVLGCSKVRAQGWGNEVRGSPETNNMTSPFRNHKWESDCSKRNGRVSLSIFFSPCVTDDGARKSQGFSSKSFQKYNSWESEESQSRAELAGGPVNYSAKLLSPQDLGHQSHEPSRSWWERMWALPFLIQPWALMIWVFASPEEISISQLQIFISNNAFPTHIFSLAGLPCTQSAWTTQTVLWTVTTWATRLSCLSRRRTRACLLER